MKKFNYKVKGPQGETLSGEIEASTQQDAAKILISKKLVPVDIKEVTEKTFSIDNIPFLSALDKVSKKKKSIAIRQFATLIRSGLSITQSLETLAKEAANEKLKKTFENILKSVEAGSALSQAFAENPDVFSGIDISLVKAGEKSGTLDKVLDRMAGQLEKEASLISKIRGAMIYPAIVLIVAGGVIAVMLVYLVPKLEDLYTDFKGTLPFITRVMVGLSDFLVNYWWVVILLILAAIFGFVSFIKNPSGKKLWDTFKIKAPVLKTLLEKIYMARYNRTMETLVGSGVSITDSLNITSRAVGNVLYEEEIGNITEKVRGGKSLAQGMSESELFPSVATQMIKVGEETGEVDNMLSSLANYYEEEVDNIVKSIATIIEPVMIVVMGVVVLLILVGIMSPIYSIAQLIFGR